MPTDDRGNPCPVAGMTWKQLAWHALGVRLLTFDPESKRQMKFTQTAEYVGMTVGTTLGMVVAVALWQVWMPGMGLLTLMVFYLPFGFAFGVPLWRVALRWARRRRFADIAPIYLDAGRCPGCGYTLRDLPIEPDGCVACPECGSAWRSGRIGPDAAADEHHA